MTIHSSSLVFTPEKGIYVPVADLKQPTLITSFAPFENLFMATQFARTHVSAYQRDLYEVRTPSYGILVDINQSFYVYHNVQLRPIPLAQIPHHARVAVYLPDPLKICFEPIISVTYYRSFKNKAMQLVVPTYNNVLVQGFVLPMPEKPVGCSRRHRYKTNLTYPSAMKVQPE
jgi:hypothetical protein